MRLLLTTIVALLAARAGLAGGLSDAEFAAGQKLAAAKCVACHKMRDPSAYSPEQWDLWMEKMRRKARLNEENFQKLARYFEALRQQSAAAATTPP